MSHPALAHLDHRPWPIPSRPWAWRQTWHDLLFLHWRLPAAALRPLVPAALQLEEFDGSAWVALTPFWMSGVTVRGTPALPWVSRFPELNVRTYVRAGSRPGVWFFSLDAANWLAVRVAGRLFHLPYHVARMRVQRKGSLMDYHSERQSGGTFDAAYGPTGPVSLSSPGSLEHWLTERYCLYAVAKGQLHRAEIHHDRWPLQPGEVHIRQSDLLQSHGLEVSGAPVSVLFSARIDVIVWSLEPVGLPEATLA